MVSVLPDSQRLSRGEVGGRATQLAARRLVIRLATAIATAASIGLVS